ncbi:precorrin-6Y C5,15-methyltransferase (decarboxylating) subunit CbiT [Thermosediminibacter oceani]|nr:precorrin-6Y C5,15-methyltransferase (decarboxylating) subunit CbiT [Thermosediminibacter oceani]
MTKEETRVISLAKMRLKKNSVVWDIGAGTGSVSVEAALFCSEGRVFAVEKDKAALGLIVENARKFGATNLVPVPGEAPEALENLPDPDRIFIGGTGERTADVLKAASSRLKKDGVMVINAVTVETVYAATGLLEGEGFEWDLLLVNIASSRKAGQKHMMIARNPVFIITARPMGRDFENGECA